MSKTNSVIGQIIRSWPGKERFGNYRFLPIFFVLGAALEFSMINWHIGETNFCKLSIIYTDLFVLKFTSLDRTFKKRQAKNLIEEKLHEIHN